MNKRSGFSLIELIIVTVLGTMVAGAAYQVLLVNQRTYTAQNVQIAQQQTARAGLDVLFGELRELSRQGDIVGFWADSLKVRTGRNFGLVCETPNYANGQVKIRKVGSWFGVGDSVVVYAENNVSSANDDDWLYGKVTAVDTTQTCNGAAAQRLTIPVIQSAAAAAVTATTPDSVRLGGNVRSFTTYRYGQFSENSVPYLGRKDSTNTMTPLVGPVKASSGVAFRYLDSTNAVTTTAARINQIEVTIRTESTARDRAGTALSDSVKTRIFIRN